MTEEKKPMLVQIDDKIREMTPEEIADYEAWCATAFRVPSAE